jgi:hypothetical protein
MNYENNKPPTKTAKTATVTIYFIFGITIQTEPRRSGADV